MKALSVESLSALESQTVGLCEINIDMSQLEVPLHENVIGAVSTLKAAAQAAGFDLTIASGYRSFQRQLSLWNAKACGEKPLLDADERPLVAVDLSPRERLFALLRWSALPGTSRHHWGTDMDIYDKGALREGQTLQLTVAETQEGGPFYAMYQWLDHFLAKPDCAFFRPYARDMGGVSPEPWHLSCRAQAGVYAGQLSLPLIERVINNTEIALKSEILASLDEIYRRYVVNVC